MSCINLHTDKAITYTNVPDFFIDRYLSSANGEFVKVYLYLLRCLRLPGKDVSISSIADFLNHTEADIRRALGYWEKLGILRLEYDSDSQLAGICFVSSPDGSLTPESVSGKSPHLSFNGEGSRHLPLNSNGGNSEVSFDNHSGGAVSGAVSFDNHSGEAVLFGSQKKNDEGLFGIPKQKDYSADEIKAFKTDNQVREIFYIAETYLRRTLSPTDCQILLYIFDSLKFPAELLEYLVEYCVSKGHTSIRYIEKTAIAWHKQGIRDTDTAKELSHSYTKSHSAVMKAFGIRCRNLAQGEAQLVDKWNLSYGFSPELITEACNRTMKAIHQPSFEYADKILDNWRSNKVTNMDDIAKLDMKYKSSYSKAMHEAGKKPVPIKNSSFHNFPQREYDFDKLQRQLVLASSDLK